jgi:hypothetical protein
VIRDKVRQIGIRATEAFYNRLEVERKARDLSIQGMIVSACEQVWAQGVKGKHVTKNVSPFWATPEQEELVRVLFKAIQNFPPEKIEMERQRLELDADAYTVAATRSSRFQSRFQSRFKGRFGTEQSE